MPPGTPEMPRERRGGPRPDPDTLAPHGASERAGGAAGRVLVAPAPPSPDIREADFLALVLDYARALDYECYHTWRSDHAAAGFPDCVIVGHGQIVFAELKARRGRLTVDQCRWARAIVRAGGTWRLWRPDADSWLEMQQLLGGVPGTEEG